MGKVDLGLVCMLLGLAALARAASPSPAPTNESTIIPGGPPAMNTPGIRPGTSGHSLRKLLQPEASAAILTTVLADPSFAPGPGRRTTIVSYASAPGPDQQITVGTIKDGKLQQTVLKILPASPPAALSAGRKLLQGSWGWNDHSDGKQGGWNRGEHRGNDNGIGWGGRNAGQGSGGNAAAAASAAAAVAKKGGSASAAAAAAASASPGSAAASAAAATAASGKDASAVAAAAASAAG